ncbi:transposase, partial [Enterobacter hormaechei subsp. hoffmannii]|nr:transposase [Enterobacter hormaechei subsp. hoffmannii]MCU3508184.1 transposase [Enterobacter hormaechei subsp. hoffmannii]MCU3984437.1 transposase [Enterobacter hormaechei subsp. hoffmannii]
AYGPQNDVTLKMPAFEWVHVQLHQQKGMISLSPPTICNSAKNAAKTIGKRLYGILNAMRHSVSNGNAEALNSKIRLLRIKARGYRNRERFKLGVMFHYGKLNMAF